MRSGIWAGRKVDLIIALHNAETPTDSEWEAYCQLLQRALHDSEKLWACNITLGGAPNALQRRRINQLERKAKPRGSVMTDSALVRGVITALMWASGGDLRAFRMREHHAAFRYCGVEEDEIASLVAEMSALGEGLEGGNPMRIALAAK